jgi:hypothetical protein
VVRIGKPEPTIVSALEVIESTSTQAIAR